MTIRVRHHGEERQFESMADVRAALGDGRLGPAAEVWHPLTESWRSLSDVPTAAGGDGLPPAPADVSAKSAGAAAAPSPSPPAPAAPVGGPTSSAQGLALGLPPFRQKPAVLIAGGAAVVGLLVLLVILLAGRGRQGDGGVRAGAADAICDKVSCSGHGNCVVLRGEPTCACEDGYHAEGLNCVRIPPPYIPARPSQVVAPGSPPSVPPAPTMPSPPAEPGHSGYLDLAFQSAWQPVVTVHDMLGPMTGCKTTCRGCCDGETCLPGRTVDACGVGGRPCQRCTNFLGMPGVRPRCDGTCGLEVDPSRYGEPY